MNVVILNIEIANRYEPFPTMRAMRRHNMPLMKGHVHTRDGVHTLVAETSAPDNVIHDLSAELGEDCIAVYDLYHREGRLVGPNTEPWGPFDPAKFILLNGSLLSEARSVA